MSAGAFVRSRYESDDGEIHPIRVQPETLSANVGAVNAGAAGAATSSLSAKARGGNREYGLKARSVTVAFTGSVPDDYEPGNTYRIPILTQATYDAAVVGGTGTYLDNPIEIVGKSPERVR